MRGLLLLLLFNLMLAAVTLATTRHARDLMRQRDRLVQAGIAAREHGEVLRLEWVYLTTPSRLEQLAADAGMDRLASTHTSTSSADDRTLPQIVDGSAASWPAPAASVGNTDERRP